MGKFDVFGFAVDLKLNGEHIDFSGLDRELGEVINRPLVIDHLFEGERFSFFITGFAVSALDRAGYFLIIFGQVEVQRTQLVTALQAIPGGDLRAQEVGHEGVVVHHGAAHLGGPRSHRLNGEAHRQQQ